VFLKSRPLQCPAHTISERFQKEELEQLSVFPGQQHSPGASILTADMNHRLFINAYK
jgi:hypothetical protein